VNRTLIAACLISIALISGCRTADRADATSSGARLYKGLDRYHWPMRTSSSEAQRWFDQGVQLLYGFNHDEAIRSFHAAASHDPNSPMPWWGIAYAWGMNINRPMMTDDRWRAAWEAARNAEERLDGAPTLEAALVRAISARYAWPPPAEQRTLDEAYAAAMESVWKRFPRNPDIAALYAESLMDLQPWDYWTADGEPKGRIDDIVSVLESALARHPDHPGLCHLYIHAMEAARPEKAVAAADRLADRVPGSGHLVHMPSHIYVRTGRYADAADANVRAIAADRAYFRLAPEPDYYWGYYAHNLHFLAFSSMMESRYEEAMRAARDLEREIPEWYLRQYGGFIEGVMPTIYHVMIRFGRWEDILAEPQRPEYRLVSRAVHHYARGIALSALGRTAEARAEVDRFEEAVAEVPEDWWVFNNRVHQVLPIARAMLEGELAFREGRHDEAFAALRRGVAAEDALVYDEPPAWMLPVRHALGALLMSAGRYEEAETVYREDLRRNAENGWSLLGLREALAAQRRSGEAPALQSRLAAAWKRADVAPTSSCFCEPGRRR
jgi:tetratricopeptide (TPR) repeat protein